MQLSHFHQKAGLQPGQRDETRAVQLRQLVNVMRRAPGRGTNLDELGGGAESTLDLESMWLIEGLRKTGASSMESELTAQYDVLERHELIRNAMEVIDKRFPENHEMLRLKDTLSKMLAGLKDRNPDALAKGLQSLTDFQATLQAMNLLSKDRNPKHDPAALQQLRTMFGDKSAGREPITPIKLAMSLQEKFGSDNFVSAMASLRSKMAAGFRANPATSAGPRLWLSLSDAAAFNVVQSSVAIAGELRRDLPLRAGLMPKETLIATTLAFLGIGEPGGSRAERVVEKIVNGMNASMLQLMQAYMLVSQAVQRLPVAIWQQGNMQQRLDFLDEMRRLAIEKSSAVPSLASPEDELLEKWLREEYRRNKREKDDENSDDAESSRVGSIEGRQQQGDRDERRSKNNMAKEE